MHFVLFHSSLCRVYVNCTYTVYSMLFSSVLFCFNLACNISMLPIVLSAAEIIPGMEAPPPVTQEPILQDASGESFDDPPNSFQDSSAESRRDSHKHASSSGTKDTTPSSHSSSDTSSSSRKPTDHAANSSTSGNGASSGEESADNARQQQQSGNGNGNGNGAGGGEASLPDGVGAEQVKQAVSIVGNKMQQVVHKEGVDIASRSALASLH